MSEMKKMFPVAEIHWRNKLRNFGFMDPSVVERHWKNTCTSYTNVLLDPESNVVRLLGPEITQPIAISLHDQLVVERLLKDGYRFDSRPLWHRGDLCILKLAKRLPSYPRNNAMFAIMSVDTHLKTVIGTMKLEANDGKNIMRDVEIWDGVMSPDREVLGLSIGMVKHSHAIFESFETFVTLFHIKTQTEIRRLANLDNIMYAVDFDPRIESTNNYVLAGVCADDANSRCIATYEIGSANPLKKCSVEHLMDSEGDNAFYISYTRNGQYIVFQVLEGLGYSDEWLYNTYIFHSDTLEMIGKLRPAMTSGCHQNCIPFTKPIQSRCSDFLALPNAAKSGRRRDWDIILYRLPLQTDLTHQCRSVVLRNLRSSQDISQLPLPKKMRTFLMQAIPHQERER